MNALLYFMLMCICQAVSVSSDSSHVYLQWGKPGEIANPHVIGDVVDPKQFSTAYWYKMTPEGESLLITNYEGTIIKYYNRYNMTENGALIVNNVTGTDGGLYISKVVKSGTLLESLVNVSIFVSPSEPAPWIEECGLPNNHNDDCTLQLPSEETEYHLTCHVTGARPAVDLHLQRVLADVSEEVVQQVLLRVHREDGPQYGAIYDRDKALFSSTLYFNGTFHGNTTFLCVATGLAMGRNNDSAMQVHVWKPPDDMHMPSTAKLITEWEKGTVQLVFGNVSIIVLIVCVAVLLILAFVLKKKGCKCSQLATVGSTELQPFLSKGPTAEERLSSELKDCYLKPMGTIPTHPSNFALTMKIEDIFVLPVLSRVTNKSVKSEMLNINRRGLKQVYLDVPDKKPVHSLNDLIQILIDNQHVVVVGHPGSGKNTIVTKIAHDFATGDLNSFKYIFILRKKEMNNNTGVLSAMHSVLGSETQLSNKQGLRDVISNHQKEVLIILDGVFLLEALSADTGMSVSDDDISFEDLLSLKYLMDCFLLVMACPHQLQQLQSYYSDYTVVEATGLSVECSNEYIHKFFFSDASKADVLDRAVQSDADLATLAQSPLTLQVLCRIWQARNKLPERMAELYDKVLEAKVNNLEKKYGIAKPHMDSLKKDIGRVAYDGLTRDPKGEQHVFFPEDFPAVTLEQGLKIGVLSQETRTSEEGTVPIVKYLHLFQDYFAAHYVLTDPATLLPRVCKEHMNDNEHLLRFCRELSDEAAGIIHGFRLQC